MSTLAADVAALQDDAAGIDGNLTTAALVQMVESAVTEAIDDLGELGEVEFFKPSIGSLWAAGYMAGRRADAFITRSPLFLGQKHGFLLAHE